MSIEILDERNEMETNNTKTLDVNWKKLAHYIRNRSDCSMAGRLVSANILS